MTTPRTPLERFMRDKSVSDEEFAALVGRSRTQVLRIRSGVSTPPDALKTKIAEVTGGLVPVTAWFPTPQDEAA